MSFFVVVGVAALVFFYVTANRRARQSWLQKLDLIGRWHWQEGDGELLLHGRPDKGEFELREDNTVQRGRWRLQGHFLHLEYAQGPKQDQAERFDLHYFKPGNIGLQDADGTRRVYSKETSNVVPLRNH